MTAPRTPECPLESEFARSSIMARVSATESGSPIPTAWERTRLTCSSRIWSPAMRTSASLPTPGGDGVRHAVFRDQRVHHRAGAIDSLAGVGIKQDGTALDCDFPDRFESQILSVDVQGFQASFRFPVSGFKGALIFLLLREMSSEYLAAAVPASSSRQESCAWFRLPPAVRHRWPAPVRSQNE